MVLARAGGRLSSPRLPLWFLLGGLKYLLQEKKLSLGESPRLSKNFFGRSRRARRPSDCIRIAWLCRAGGAVSASAETIPYIFCGRQL